MTIETICNQALDVIGYKRHIGSVWDGTKAARVALDAWAETRDALLTTVQPEWAKKDIGLTPSKTAPSDGYDTVTVWTTTYPDIPWLYEYTAPADCLVPLTLKPRIHTIPAWRPRFLRFRAKMTSTNYVILGNVPDPVLTYIWRVTNVTLWHEDFVELMIEALSRKFARALIGAPPQQEKSDANAA